MNISLYDSFVEHRSLNPRANFDHLIEGSDNNVTGWMKDRRFVLEFVNSFGKKSLAAGHFFKIGKYVFAYGVAAGYSTYPEGRTCVAFGSIDKKSKTVTLRLPAFDANYLKVQLKYRTNLYT
jgi:hypothetical protein